MKIKATIALILILLTGIVTYLLNKKSFQNQAPAATNIHETTSTEKNNTEETSILIQSNKTISKNITDTEKSYSTEEIEKIPEKIEPSKSMKKVRTEDGHVLLYDTEGRLIKKQFPDGKIELYNYTRDGEKILVEY